jgi:hypothetical protein
MHAASSGNFRGAGRTPFPSWSIEISDLAGNISENIGAQSLAGKIFEKKDLGLLPDPAA